MEIMEKPLQKIDVKCFRQTTPHQGQKEFFTDTYTYRQIVADADPDANANTEADADTYANTKEVADADANADPQTYTVQYSVLSL